MQSQEKPVHYRSLVVVSDCIWSGWISVVRIYEYDTYEHVCNQLYINNLINITVYSKTIVVSV